MLVLIRGTHITDVHIPAHLFVGERRALSTTPARRELCTATHRSKSATGPRGSLSGCLTYTTEKSLGPHTPSVNLHMLI